MKTSYLVFVGSLLVSVASYVSGHEEITTFNMLFGNVQHFFGLLGVVGAVVGAFFAKSPMTVESKPQASTSLDIN